MKKVISFYLSTEVNIEDFKSWLSNLIGFTKKYALKYDGKLVIDGKYHAITNLESEIDEFERFINENAYDDNSNSRFPQVSFKSDSKFIVRESKHNDIELGNLEVENSIVLISPYKGRVDSVNIQLIIDESTDLSHHKSELNDAEELTCTIHLADEDGNYYEVYHEKEQTNNYLHSSDNPEVIIKYQLEQLDLKDSESEIEIIITVQNGVTEELFVKHGDLELDCKMVWNQGSFEVVLKEKELKDILSTKPFHTLTNEDLLDNFDWELDETSDGHLELNSLNGKSNDEDVISVLKDLDYWADADDIESVIHDIYKKGNIEDSEYLFEGLNSIVISDDKQVSIEYWSELLGLTKDLIKDEDFETAKEKIYEFVKWETQQNLIAEAHFYSGEISYHEQDWDEAIKHYTKAIQTGYEKSDVYQSLGWSYRQTNQFEESIKSYKKSADLDPSAESSYYMIGMLSSHIGNSEEALNAYSKCIELNSDNAEYFQRRGDLYIKLGQLKAAKHDFETFVKVNPKNAYGFYRLGLINKELKEHKDAAINLSSAQELNEKMKQDRGIWVARAWSEYSSKDYKASIASYSKVIQLEEDANSYYQRGNSFLHNDEPDKAITDFKASIKLNPSSKFSFFGLGKALAAQKEYARAIEAFNKAIEIDENYKWAYLEQSKSLVEIESLDEALAASKKAAEIDPDWTPALNQTDDINSLLEK